MPDLPPVPHSADPKTWEHVFRNENSLGGIHISSGVSRISREVFVNISKLNAQAMASQSSSSVFSETV